MKKICWVIVVAAVALVGCGEKSAAKKAVLETLKDPDSAKFGEFSLVTDNFACFAVNAKNSMGGYSGYQQAYLRKVNGKWESYMMYDESHETCVEYMEKKKTKRD